jgi:hypothetical protein
MQQKTPYDQTLRAIGQSLETQNVVVFDLKPQGSMYSVRAVVQKVKGLLTIFQKETGLRELNYTPQDIDRCDKEGRARRQKSGRLPDFRSLSNMLRAIGSYLDEKGAQLLQIQKGNQTVMILYKNIHGHPEVEERSLAAVSDMSLQMYKQRQKKTP